MMQPLWEIAPHNKTAFLQQKIIRLNIGGVCMKKPYDVLKEIQTANIRNEMVAKTIDPANIRRIIREYCSQLYTQKSHNLDGVDQFLKKHKLPQYTQYEIGSLDRSTTINEI